MRYLLTFFIVSILVSPGFTPVYATGDIIILDEATTNRGGSQKTFEGFYIFYIECNGLETIDTFEGWFDAQNSSIETDLYIDGDLVSEETLTGRWGVAEWTFSPAQCGDIRLEVKNGFLNLGTVNNSAAIDNSQYFDTWERDGFNKSGVTPLLTITASEPDPTLEINSLDDLGFLFLIMAGNFLIAYLIVAVFGLIRKMLP